MVELREHRQRARHRCGRACDGDGLLRVAQSSFADTSLPAGGNGGGAQPPSPLRKRNDIDGVLATTELTRAVVRGDAVGVTRLSRVVTDASARAELKERTI